MKLIIDRNEWLRGEGPDESRLIRSLDGKKCCIGILGCALGLDKHCLTDETVADRTVNLRWPPWCLDNIIFGSLKPDIWEAYEINDNTEIPDGDREAKLTEIFSRHDIQVEFIN